MTDICDPFKFVCKISTNSYVARYSHYEHELKCAAVFGYCCSRGQRCGNVMDIDFNDCV